MLPLRMERSALHVHDFSHSRFGAPGRAVRVWLPAGYADEPERRYPVLYLQDGQNLFEAETSFLGVSWQAQTTAQKLIDKKRIEPAILVGVDNAGAHRLDDYTPVSWGGRGGSADRFGRMLTDEIKPWVDRHYRTRPDRESTGVGGASLGGLFALHMAMSRPDVFGLAAAMSPSLGWGNGEILTRIASLDERLPVRIGIDIGKREPAGARQLVRTARELLNAKGWGAHRFSKKATLRHVEAARAAHDEASWGKRFDRVLTFLFPRESRARRRRPVTAAAS
jgi:predicted alpha/beta superfamily hydrolase